VDTLTQAYCIAPNLRRAMQNSRTKIRSALMHAEDMEINRAVADVALIFMRKIE
jgi:hypothetical protein